MLRSRDRDLECTHVHANTKIQLDQVRIMGNLNVELTAELTATFLWQKGTYRNSRAEALSKPDRRRGVRSHAFRSPGSTTAPAPCRIGARPRLLC